MAVGVGVGVRVGVGVAGGFVAVAGSDVAVAAGFAVAVGTGVFAGVAVCKGVAVAVGIAVEVAPSAVAVGDAGGEGGVVAAEAVGVCAGIGGAEVAAGGVPPGDVRVRATARNPPAAITTTARTEAAARVRPSDGRLVAMPSIG